MDIRTMQELTQEAVKKKFGNKRYLPSRVIPRYPQNLERKYVRVANSYMNLFSTVLSEYIPRLRDVLQQSGLTEDAANPSPTIDEIFDELFTEFTSRQGLFDLSEQINKMSNLNRKLTIAEWKRVVKRTLGIDIFSDYYNGVKFQQLSNSWVLDNVGMIQTIPQETLEKMRQIVKNGYSTGASTRSIARQIQKEYSTSRSHAQFIARP